MLLFNRLKWAYLFNPSAAGSTSTSSVCIVYPLVVWQLGVLYKAPPVECTQTMGATFAPISVFEAWFSPVKLSFNSTLAAAAAVCLIGSF